MNKKKQLLVEIERLEKVIQYNANLAHSRMYDRYTDDYGKQQAQTDLEQAEQERKKVQQQYEELCRTTCQYRNCCNMATCESGDGLTRQRRCNKHAYTHGWRWREDLQPAH